MFTHVTWRGRSKLLSNYSIRVLPCSPIKHLTARLFLAELRDILNSLFGLNSITPAQKKQARREERRPGKHKNLKLATRRRVHLACKIIRMASLGGAAGNSERGGGLREGGRGRERACVRICECERESMFAHM